MQISVVTVCFNSADTIGDTLEAVRSQDGARVEHIVVDGGSTDGTQAVVGRCNGQVAKFISEPDEGIYDAMNKGIRLATATWSGASTPMMSTPMAGSSRMWPRRLNRRISTRSMGICSMSGARIPGR